MSALLVRGLCLAGLITAGAAVLTAHAQTPWDARYFNPTKPLPDDVPLPLPCGGSMVFRPVVTPPETQDALADMSVQLGRDEESTGYIDYIRHQHLLGSLSRPDATWYFLIGKFAVTADQWNAVMQPDRCAPPSDTGLLPKGDIGWFDAVDYARRLTEWLLHERKGVLPRQGNETSFLRLPTEVEWEFAARGGIAVGKAEFAAERFFSDTEPFAGYVVFAEPGRPHVARPVGSRKPNQLGLYDMLGNVEQWVLDPFHANRQGRDHGESGGLVTRGGSYDTAQAGIRTSARTEYPSYDSRTGSAWRQARIGFRLVVAAPVLFSAQRTDALKQAWIELSKFGGRTTEGNEVVPEIEHMASDAQDPALLAKLDSLKHDVLVEREQRDEVEARLFRTAMLNGALLVRGLRQDTRLAAVLREAIPYWRRKVDEAKNSKDQTKVVQYDQILSDVNNQYAQADERRQLAARGYTDAIVQLAQNARANQQETQRDRLTKELNASGLGALVPNLSSFDSALSVYRAEPDMGVEALVRLITEDGSGSH